MKAQINITDVDNNGRNGLSVKVGAAANGAFDDDSDAMKTRAALEGALRLLTHPQLGESFGTTLASYSALAVQLEAQAKASAEEELEEEISDES